MFAVPQITFGHAMIVGEHVNVGTSATFSKSRYIGAVILLWITVLIRTVVCVTKVCLTYSTCYIGVVTRISSRV